MDLKANPLTKLFSELAGHFSAGRDFLQKSQLRSLRNLSILPPDARQAVIGTLLDEQGTRGEISWAEKNSCEELLSTWADHCASLEVHGHGFYNSLRYIGQKYIQARDFMLYLSPDNHLYDYDQYGRVTNYGTISRTAADRLQADCA